MKLTPEQKAEIAAERAQSRPTRRATVPALEEILYEALPVLDHEPGRLRASIPAAGGGPLPAH